MSTTKKLLKNTAIYTVANFSTSLIAFLLIPMYTIYLTPKNYGDVDYILTLVGIIAPIISVQITHGVFRFLMDFNQEKEQSVIFSNSMFILFFGIIVFSLVAVPCLIIKKDGMLILGYVLIIVSLLEGFLAQVARALKKNTVFAASGVISGVVQILANIILITSFGYKGESLLIAPIVGNIISIIFLCFCSNIKKYIRPKSIDKEKIKDLLKYCIPLVPEMILWWFLNSYSRFAIKLSLGSAELGIFAIAFKFATIVTILYGLFNMAWQEIGYKAYADGNENIFYSKMWNYLVRFVCGCTIVALPSIRIFIAYFLSESYAQSYMYVAPLFLSSVIYCFSCFYSTVFSGAKKTGSLVKSNLFGAITNMLLIFFVIKVFGVMGVCVSLLISHIILFVVRQNTAKKYITIKREQQIELFVVIILFLSGVVYYMNIIIQFIVLLIGVIIFLQLNKELILKVLNAIKTTLIRRRVSNE